MEDYIDKLSKDDLPIRILNIHYDPIFITSVWKILMHNSKKIFLPDIFSLVIYTHK